MARMPLVENPRYQVDSEPLASGGMGLIWSAHDRDLQRRVAVKTLRAELERSPRAFDRLAREVTVQAGLAHPGVVPVYDSHLLDDVPCFVMKLVDGAPMSRHLDQLRRAYVGRHEAWFASDELRALIERMVTVCYTIDYAHQHGVIHRDLKPANLLLDSRGDVFVHDWGVARTDELDPAGPDSPALPRQPVLTVETATGDGLGTPWYMSPEQLRGARDATPATDIWSLGRILDEIAHIPDGERAGPPQALRSAATNHYLPPGLHEVIVHATQPDPDERYPSVSAMRAALQHDVLDDAATADRWRRLAGQLWNEQDESAIDGLFHPDVVVHSGYDCKPFAGTAALHTWYREIRQGFPDATLHIDALLADGRGHLALHATLQGCHTGTFLGLPPTGRRATIFANWMCRLRGARAIEVHCLFDRLALFRELGLLRASPGHSP
ncbi:MAG: ester cyclase [Planctomycetota bacterium]